MVGMVGIVVFVTVFALPSSPRTPDQSVSDIQFWYVMLFPPVRMFEFTLGVIVARIVKEGLWPRIPVWLLFAACVAGFALAIYGPEVVQFELATMIPLALLIGSAANADLNGKSGLLASRPAVWLGELTYAFYILQGVTVFYVRWLIGDQTYGVAAALGFIAALFAVNLLASWLIYRFFEAPIARRFSRPRTRPVQRQPVVLASAFEDPAARKEQ
jgi:peptidoglycan/LPS O-acetylase OafA/YrhL